MCLRYTFPDVFRMRGGFVRLVHKVECPAIHAATLRHRKSVQKIIRDSIRPRVDIDIVIFCFRSFLADRHHYYIRLNASLALGKG